MVVQYKGGTRYICNYLRQQYRTPSVNILRPIRSIRGWSTRFSRPSRLWNSMSTRRRWPSGSSRPSALPHAQAQHLERLRYEAAYCERQFRHVDPAHRHVAAELEHAWEVALQALKQAEAAQQQRAQASDAA